MKNIAFAFLFFVLAPVPALPQPPQVDFSQKQLVAAMRFLNTYEYRYADENQRFGSLDELLSWLKKTGKINEAPFSLSAEDLKPYELRITAAPDGKRYQISLLRPSECKPAAFTDDRGLIFLGLVIGCESPDKPSD